MTCQHEARKDVEPTDLCLVDDDVLEELLPVVTIDDLGRGELGLDARLDQGQLFEGLALEEDLDLVLDVCGDGEGGREDALGALERLERVVGADEHRAPEGEVGLGRFEVEVHLDVGV